MVRVPHEDFAARLQKLLDHARFHAGRGRTAALATRYGVSRETARKWLTGLSLPELERMIELAVDFGGNFEWLATGRGHMHVASGVREMASTYDAGVRGELWSVVSSLPEAKQQALLQLLTK